MATTCGNCKGEVSDGETMCPHCGALLAAYASPTGATTVAPEYTTPSYAAPPVVVHEDTAPEPLFDTNVTIEAVSAAADQDHPVELLLAGVDVPSDPEIREHPSEPAQVEPVVREKRSESPSVDHPIATRPTPARKRAEPTRKKEDPPESPTGETESYLRKLHERAGYTGKATALSAPVTSGRPSPEDRAANRAAQKSAQNRGRPQPPAKMPGSTRVIGLVVIVFWAGVLLATLAGISSMPLIIFTVVLTIWFKMVQNENRR